MDFKIAILLSTYNAEPYLREQLDSLHAQSYQKTQIIARDDISIDNTLDILNSYDIELIQSSKNLGAKESFGLLLRHALENSDAEYFMFCDQDDIWESNKIEKTLSKIEDMKVQYGDIPLLVHTDLKVVDEKLNILNNSFWSHEYILPKHNSLSRLLVQNTITGCTMMINRRLAQLCLPVHTEAIMHDWWIGLNASQFGKIGYIKDSTMLYRQHSNNTIGAKGFSYVSIFLRFYKVFYKNELYLKHLNVNIKQAKAFLDIHRDNLDKNTIKMLEDFTTIEKKSFFQKRAILLKHKLLKQGLIRNIGLLLKI